MFEIQSKADERLDPNYNPAADVATGTLWIIFHEVFQTRSLRSLNTDAVAFFQQLIYSP